MPNGNLGRATRTLRWVDCTTFLSGPHKILEHTIGLTPSRPSDWGKSYRLYQKYLADCTDLDLLRILGLCA